MPIIKIETNLKDDEIPEDFEVELHKFMAPLLGKDLIKLVTTLETSRRMTVGDNRTAPIFLLRCWSFNVFGDLEKRNYYSVEIYKFIKKHFSNLTYENIKVLLHDMPQIDVGPKPSN